MSIQRQLVQYMTQRTGKIRYSQLGDRMHPDQTGQADCSSLAHAAYRDVAGIRIGTYTDNQITGGWEVFGTWASYDDAIARLQPGDLIFFRWSSPPPGAWWSHVEMYMGNGYTIGHGGSPYYGPVAKSLRAQWNWASHIAARRYVSGGAGGSGSGAGAGGDDLSVNSMIRRPDGHTATLAAHIGDIAQRVIALTDGTAPMCYRPNSNHGAPIGVVLGNIESRVVEMHDGNAPKAPRPNSSHAAGIGAAVGNMEARIVEMFDMNHRMLDMLTKMDERLTKIEESR